MKASFARMAPLLGFSFFWTSSLVRRATLSTVGSYLPSMPQSVHALTGLAVFLLFVVVYRKGRWNYVRVPVALFVIASAFCGLFANNPAAPESLRAVAGFLMAAAQPLSAGLWIGWLISVDSESFPLTFVLAALANLTLTMLLLALPDLAREKTALLMEATSGLLIFSIVAPEPLAPGIFGRMKQSARPLTIFVLIRILIGVLNCLMVVTIVTLHAQGGESALVRALSAVVAAVSFTTLLVYGRKASVGRNTVVALLSLIPLAAALPLAANGLDALSMLLPVFYWFTAFSFSNIHLYRNKNLCGASPLAISCAAVVLTSVGDVLVRSLPLEPFLQSLTPLARIAPMVLVSYLASLVALLLLASTLSRRSNTSPATLEQAVRRLSRKYGLTPRETEVFALLARGYSRPYISEKLVVSQATVKTHINNIYLKMGINKHDSLLALVEEERQKD